MADHPGGTTHHALYRRYRPQRFAEVKGQDHVTRALRNAVRDDRVSHGYLFSGPRGTGKTTTARILAKALNCTKLDDGEPCGVCDSCQAVQNGTGFDVIELDAASNNGVDAMRDLVARAALGTPGRAKVYIIDEVHMLSAAAANTLLKTLEEPPDHVVFVLATTDPQKVLPTIRSRVQHFEFHLFANDVLTELVRSVHDDARLGLSPDDLDAVVRRAGGSARDALSVLEHAAALGAADVEVPVAAEVVEAIADRDAGRALAAVAQGAAAGRDPRRLAEEILQHLRNVFLTMRAPALVDAAPAHLELLTDQAARLSPAAILRAMEVVGEALAEMREALDPRITLEVALVRVTAVEADTSPAALLERIERLERSGGRAPAASATASAAPVKTGRVAAPPPPPGPPPADTGDSGGTRSRNPGPRASSSAPPPTRDELVMAWGDKILPSLPTRVRNRIQIGRFTAVEDGSAIFALPDRFQVDRCEQVRSDVEAAIAQHFGRPLPVRLVVDEGSRPPARAADDDDISYDELVDATDVKSSSPTDRLKQAFPGTEEVEEAT